MPPSTWSRRRAAAGIGAVVAGAPFVGAAADGAVDVALVLAVDTSGSVNQERFELQRRGYADAFRSTDVIMAIRRGKSGGGIAVTMTHWTGPTQQMTVVPWRRVDTGASAFALADLIAAAPRALFSGGTSISGAIDNGVAALKACPFEPTRQVIDVSGDGANNRGRDANLARDDAIRAGISINGLPILALERNLDDYYLSNVVGGPGAFMIVAESYATFGDAVRRKLIQEIAGLPGRGVRTT
jgi:hypothetical protein